MKVQTYLLNKTHIAEDRTTGLMGYGATEELALKELQALVDKYWEKKKVVVPITTTTDVASSDSHSQGTSTEPNVESTENEKE